MIVQSSNVIRLSETLTALRMRSCWICEVFIIGDGMSSLRQLQHTRSKFRSISDAPPQSVLVNQTINPKKQRKNEFTKTPSDVLVGPSQRKTNIETTLQPSTTNPYPSHHPEIRFHSLLSSAPKKIVMFTNEDLGTVKETLIL